MSCFELENNNFDLELIKFANSYIKELTYYGTSNTNQMMTLIEIGQEINTMEKNIVEIYYNYYVSDVLNDILNPNIYYLHKILYSFTNLIFKMVGLYMDNISNTEEYLYKSRYIIGCVENYINKIIKPIETKLEEILMANKVFKLEYSTTNLKKFIDLNKTKFTSKNKYDKIYKLITLFEELNSNEKN